MTKTAPSSSPHDITRPDLSNRALKIAALLLAGALVAYVMVKPALGPLAKARLTGDAKRCNSREPVVASAVFIFLMARWIQPGTQPAVYSACRGQPCRHWLGQRTCDCQLDGPPLLMLGGLAALVLTGMIGRIYAGRSLQRHLA